MIKIDFVLRDISEILICFFTFYILQETVKIIFSLSYNIKHLISNNFNLEFAPDCFTRNQFLSEYFSNSLSRSKLLEVEYSLPATKAPYDINNFLNWIPISMDTNWIPIFLLKLVPLVRKLMGRGNKLRNLFLFFLRPPNFGSGALRLKVMHRAGSRQFI